MIAVSEVAIVGCVCNLVCGCAVGDFMPQVTSESVIFIPTEVCPKQNCLYLNLKKKNQ